MEIDFDSDKNEFNIAKHGYDLRLAIFVLSDPSAVTVQDTRKSYGEDRFITIGVFGDEIVVVVVHTPRGKLTRIISMRRANRKERKIYDAIRSIDR